MPRSGPKIIVLLAIAVIVGAIYFVERRAPAPAAPSGGGIVYINPNAGVVPSAPPAAP